MDRTVLDDAIGRMLARIDSTLRQPGEGFPHFASPGDGVWVRTPNGDWTGGFWVGLLWLAAFATAEARYREAASRWATRLQPRVASKSVFKGFLFWYGAAIGAERCGDRAAAALAREGTLGLVQMYNPAARLIPLGIEAEEAADVGPCEANIDALPGTVALLLSHGISLGSDDIGRQHLRQHVELCVRADGSVCQSATFDPADGSLVRRYTHKGIREDSTWARAQAWGMLGLAQALVWGETEFSATAQRVADWWVAHLPADRVAFWDFDDPAIPDTQRDTSATAIAAAALLKLARLIPGRRDAYEGAAAASVERLVLRYLTPVAPGDRREPGILTEGCFNRRNLTATAHELVWGDYFLFEALLALDGRLDPCSV